MNTRLGVACWLGSTGNGGTARSVGSRGVASMLALAWLLGLVRPAMAGESQLEQAQTQVRKTAAASDLDNYAEAAKQYRLAYVSTSDTNLPVHDGQAWQRQPTAMRLLATAEPAMTVAQAPAPT